MIIKTIKPSSILYKFNFPLLELCYFMKARIIFVSAFVHIDNGVFKLPLSIIYVSSPLHKIRVICVFMLALRHNSFHCKGYLKIILVKVY